MRKTAKAKRVAIATTMVLFTLASFFIWQNNDIVITEIAYQSDKVPQAFDGFVVVQVSDLHNKRFGAGQNVLLSKVEALSPDMILVTGDLVDRRRYELTPAMEFIEGALQIAPVIYVPGNHEAWSGRYDEVRQALLDAGVTVLENASYTFARDDDELVFLGARDPDFLTQNYAQGTDTSEICAFLNGWKEEDGLKILLSHRPELFDLYGKNRIDMVFSGHAHGGQIRLPFIGALYAPDQGLFPKYTSGRYEQGQTSMFVSRGLGNSLFPLRVFNRPELVCVMLQAG